MSIDSLDVAVKHEYISLDSLDMMILAQLNSLDFDIVSGNVILETSSFASRRLLGTLNLTEDSAPISNEAVRIKPKKAQRRTCCTATCTRFCRS